MLKQRFKLFLFLSAVVLILYIVISMISSLMKSPTPEATPLKSTPKVYSLPISGFLGVTWGDSIETAVTKITHNGYKMKEYNADAKQIHLEPFEMEDLTVNHCILEFSSKGFYRSFAVFGTKYGYYPTVIRLVSILKEKYGCWRSGVENCDKCCKDEVRLYNQFFFYFQWISEEDCEIYLSHDTHHGTLPDGRRYILLEYKNNKMEAEAKFESIPNQGFKNIFDELERRENERKETERRKNQPKDSLNRF